MTKSNELLLRLLKSNVRAFTDFAFRETHPGERLIGYWYLDVIADRVEAVLKRRINRLLINAPPRTLKSFIATIVLIAMYLARNPTKHVLLITGHAALANALLQRLLRLMGSPRYRSLFPHVQLFVAATTIRTRHGGGVRTAVVGQQLSGHGADLIVIDDPLSPSRAQDAKTRLAINLWFKSEVVQRLNNRDEGAIVLTMQRVHGNDLSNAFPIRWDDPGCLVLPSIATEDETWTLSDGRVLQRHRGEVLHPGRDTPETEMALWARVGDYTYATQFLQATCGSENRNAQFLYEPKPPDWTPESPPLGMLVARITYEEIIAHKAFGHSLPPYANWSTQEQYTLEDWEAMGKATQKRPPQQPDERDQEVDFNPLAWLDRYPRVTKLNR